MRRLQRWTSNKLGAGGQHAGDRVHRGDLERDIVLERRQQARQPLGQHALACAGGPDEIHVVAAGGGHLERPLGGRLAGDVGQVRSCAHRRGIQGPAGRLATADRHLGANRALGPGCPPRARRLHRPTWPRRRSRTRTTTRRTPARRAAIIAGSTPRTERRQPSRPSSAIHTTSAIASAATRPAAARMAMAMARSNRDPTLRTSAGSRASVIRRFGHADPGVEHCRPDAIPRLDDGHVRQTGEREPGQTRGQVRLDLDHLAGEPGQRHPERPRDSHLQHPPQVLDLRHARSLMDRRSPRRTGRPARTRDASSGAARRGNRPPAAAAGPPWRYRPPRPATRTRWRTSSSPHRTRARHRRARRCPPRPRAAPVTSKKGQPGAAADDVRRAARRTDRPRPSGA